MTRKEKIEITAPDSDKERRHFTAVMVLHALISRGEPLGYQSAHRAYDLAVMMSEVEAERDGLNAGEGHGL